VIDFAVIIRSNGSLAALRAIIAIRRSENSKFTLSFLSKRLGIKSRSYLTEVVKGSKNLNPKHIVPLVGLLDLPLPETELLQGKLLLDFGDLAAAEIERLKLTVRDVEKKLTSTIVEIAGVRDIHLVMMLVASFHLFHEGCATRRQILDLFKRDKHFEIERAISDLLQNGLLIREGETYRFSPEYSDRIHLYMSTSPQNEVSYLQASLKEANEYVAQYSKADKQSIFYSGIITADLAKYRDAMDHVKQNLRSIQSRIESEDADTLVRFSVQLYPVVTKNKGQIV
jgi:hypothetical protein